MPWPLKAVAVTLSGAIGVAIMANSVHWAWVGASLLASAAVYVTYTILGYSHFKGWINRSILATVILFVCWFVSIFSPIELYLSVWEKVQSRWGLPSDEPMFLNGATFHRPLDNCCSLTPLINNAHPTTKLENIVVFIYLPGRLGEDVAVNEHKTWVRFNLPDPTPNYHTTYEWKARAYSMTSVIESFDFHFLRPGTYPVICKVSGNARGEEIAYTAPR